jgi:hypothetical protein
VLGLAGFVAVELRTPAPMFDVRLVARPAYSAALVVAAVGLFGFVGVTLLQVLFLQRVQGLTPWDSAVRLSAEMGTFVLVTLLAGRLVPRTGPRRLLVGGSVLAGAGCLALLSQQPATSYAHSWPALVLLGAGCGFVVAPSTLAAVSAVPAALAAKAAAAVNAARQLGAVLGTTILGTTATTTFLAELPDELIQRDVPGPQADALVEAARTGGAGAGARSTAISDAVAAAFTAGAHAGALTAGVVFLATAGLAGLAVRDRANGGGAASAPATRSVTPTATGPAATVSRTDPPKETVR